MIESIGLNLVASGLASGGGIGIGKARSLLRQKRFSEEIDGLTTEFTSALKATVAPAITAHAEAPPTVDEVDWKAVATALDDQTVGFEDKEEAVVRLTDAIDAGVDGDLDADPERRAAVEAAVAEAYQTTIRKFTERVAGTELAEVFLMETSLDLSTAVERVDERLTAIQRELRRETAALRNVGFDRLDPLYFERHEPGDPETAWRTGFSLAEVKAGYPLPRERPATRTDERHIVADTVFERLTGGENVVVKGGGGTGKSTVCKRVACLWHADTDRGTVLYRGSATTTSFDEPGTLIDAIRAANDELLVVVEDAPSGTASAIFEVLAEFEDTSDVAFLLDARNGAWEPAAEVEGHASLERQRQQLGIVEMPVLDEQECQRAIDHYQELIDEEINRTGKQVYKKVRSADIGEPLVLAYQLTGPAIDSEGPVSALHADVRRAYTAVEGRANGEDLPQTVATMVNVLNAAGLPVKVGFVHALSTDQAAHRIIERTLDFLEGTMLEQTTGDLRTPHQLWSALYLEYMLNVVGERLARERFERCVAALFRLVDDDAIYDNVGRWVRSPSESFTAITDSPEEAAGRFVRHLADIGTIRPTLGRLYGTPETWRVQLPDRCPPDARLHWFIIRGRIHIDRGALDAAKKEFERAEQLIDTWEINNAEVIRQQDRVHNNLGLVAIWRGELDTTESYPRARVHNNLGLVAIWRGELDTAESYHEGLLTLFQEVEDVHGQAMSLHNLGLVARKRGELETAESYLKEALALFREMDDRRREGWSLGSLGVVARKRGELDTAESYLEEALTIFREEDARHGEKWILGNLGAVARKRGKLETAESYHQEALALFREIGARRSEGWCLHNLGLVARKRGELGTAESYLEESLELFREVGARYGEGWCLHNFGAIARKRGELETAESYLEESLELFREVGIHRGEGWSLHNLGLIAKARDDLELAEEYFESAVVLLREHGIIGDTLDKVTELIDVCDQRGAETTAIEWCEQAIDLAEQTGHELERAEFQERRAALVTTDE